MPENGRNNALVGAAWMIAFGAAMAAVATLVRHLSTDLPVVQVTFFRGVGALPFLLPLFWRQGFGLLKTRKPGLHILRASIGASTMTALFAAFSMVPLADATALSFLAPLFGSLLAIPLLGEFFGWRRAMSLFVAFAGAMLILRPGFSSLDAGHIFAVMAAFGLACVSILLRKLGGSEPPARIVAWFTLFMVFGTMPMAVYYWVSPDWETILLALLLGMVATGAQFCLTNAYRHAEAVQVMPWDFFRLIFAALTGWLLFDDPLGWHSLMGGGLIIGATVYSAWRERLYAQKTLWQVAKNADKL